MLQRYGGTNDILQYTTAWLSDIFSRVYENPYVLRTEGNTQLFALYAAISSESDSAVKLWRRLVKGVLERKSPCRMMETHVWRWVICPSSGT